MSPAHRRAGGHRAPVRARRRPRRIRLTTAVAMLVPALLAGSGGLLLAAGGPARASTLFGDDFEDGDAAGWSKAGGDWAVVSDGSRVLAQRKVVSELARLFAGPSTSADYAVEVRVRPLAVGSSSLVAVAARATSQTSFDRLALRADGGAELQRVRSGAVRVLARAASGARPGDWHTLRLEESGGTVRGFVDGTPVGSGGSGAAAGRIGLLTARTGAEFDDVTVTALPAAAQPTAVPTTTTGGPGPTGPAGTSTAPPAATTTTITTTATTTATGTATATGAPAPSGMPPPWPSATAEVKVSRTTDVSGVFDGGMRRFFGIGDGGQGEGQDPMFDVADGGTMQNVIIGAPAGDGIHCLGSCTLRNVWWEDVGEDAATLEGTSAAQTMTIDGGGARSAADKVFQHNGPGTMVVRNVQVEDFGKLYRSCGNCSSIFRRSVIIDHVWVTAPGKALAGVNVNFGDVARIGAVTVLGDPDRKINICERYIGNDTGDEPTKVGTGPDGVSCVYSTSDVTYR